MRSKLTEMYGARAPASVVDGLQLDDMRLRPDLRMTGELSRSARAIFVNSPLAERLMRLDQGASPRLPPVHRMFLPVPDDIRRRRVSTSRGEAVIATFGIGHPIKAPDLLIDALPLIRERHRARLVFAGSLWEPWAHDLRERAAARGVDRAVEITEDLSREEYVAWLRRATCAVQLRRWTNGESSAAIRDCIAAGVPVVTNMLGADEELGDAVASIPVEPTPARVADAVCRVLGDEAHRRAVLAAARRYAETHTVARLADEILAAVTSLEAASYVT